VAGQPRKVAGQLAHVATTPPLCPKVVVVEVKGKVVVNIGGKRGEVMAGHPPILASWPSFGLHSLLPFIIHHILILNAQATH
jgi:hypothetical protein